MYRTIIPALLLIVNLFLPGIRPEYFQAGPATAPAQQPASYISLTGDYAQLRAQFNEDVGKTRVLMLLSPA